MKILFIRSGNSGTDPISTSQGESLVKEGLNIEYFDLVGKGLTGYLSNIPRIRKRVKQSRPDLLHAHYSLSGFVTVLAFTGIPSGVSLMGSDVNASGAFQKKLIRFFSAFYWKFVIVKSGGMYKKLGVAGAFILPNGVDLGLFYPGDTAKARQRLGWNPAKKHILFASDPAREEKNYGLASQALDMLGGETDFDLHFLHEIPFADMVHYYNAADVLLMTSKHEGSPNVVKEAMACNCPVISTGVGDVAEVMNGVARTYVTGFSALEIKTRLQEILSSPGRSDGSQFTSRFDSRKIATELVAIYHKALHHD